MAIFAISDLHLSTADETNKSMEVFGRRWADYTERLRRAWTAVVSDSDTVVIPGDVSWATSLGEALSDLRFLEALPGKKILGKGNHDFWWATASKLSAFTEANHLSTISFLHNNAILVGDCAIAGTRGWFSEDDTVHGDAEKLIRREAMRLQLSLQSAKALSPARTLAFLHFPPIWNGQICRPILDVLHAHGITECFYGHIHGVYSIPASFDYEGIRMTIIAADYLEFLPKRIV